jgi:hypothetical protein
MFLFTTPAPAPAAAPEARPASPVVDAIRTGSARTGTDFDYLLRTAQRESALDPAAKAKTSSATGLFQFIEQTWLGVMKASGAEHGLGAAADKIVEARPGRFEVADPAARQQILDLRNDPKVAAVMAGAFTQRNAAQLASTLGRAPTQGELYAAHFLGPSGAGELLRKAASSPGTPATELFPEQAAANRGVFYDKASGRPKTVGELQASLAAGHERLAVPAVPKLSSDPSGWLIGRDPGRTEAPLVTAYAQADGPALHGLFRTEGSRGPVNQTVQRLWSGVSARSAGDSPRFFPRLASTSTAASDAPASGLAATGATPANLPGIVHETPIAAAVPLPPSRPKDLPRDLPRDGTRDLAAQTLPSTTSALAEGPRAPRDRRVARGQPLDLMAFLKPRRSE